MQKMVLVFCFICVFNITYSQELGRFDPLSGFEKYKLGMKRLPNDTCVKEIKGGRLNYLGFEEVTYQHNCSFEQVDIYGVKARELILTYDRSDKLIRISLYKTEVKAGDTSFQNAAQKTFDILYNHLRQNFNSKGKKKTISGVSFTEWRRNDKVIVLGIQKYNNSTTVTLDLDYKYISDGWKKALRKERKSKPE